MRKSALSVVGDVTWGSHFCQFYETKEDLLDILVPYFRAGLEKSLWKSFSDYEAAVDSVVGKYRMLALCMYSLSNCDAFEMIDVFAYRPAPAQFAVMFMDITQRKQMEAQLRQLNEQLEEKITQRTVQLTTTVDRRQGPAVLRRQEPLRALPTRGEPGDLRASGADEAAVSSLCQAVHLS
jgi:hypothetical protein